jgi:DNA-binding NtrC family response regulator
MQTQWEAVILSTAMEWRRALARTLSENGIDFAYAANIQDCKEIVARECVGLIFWDSHSPDCSFQELLNSVQFLDPKVKIVVVSHASDWDLRPPTAPAGAFGVIPFPCQPTDIEWVLSRAVRSELHQTASKRHGELQPHL